MLSPRYWHPGLLKAAMNCYPPYWGTGISIVDVARDYRRMVVQMRARTYNRNMFGTHFGGSLYAMCDPHYVILLAALLGPEYEMWDKAATIEFLRPGRGVVTAVFEWDEGQLAEIRAATAQGRKVEPVRTVDVMGEHGEHVARVHKTLYVRPKRRHRV